MKSISEMVHEYQVAVRSLRLDGVRSNIVPNSVVAAILKAAEYHQVVVVHARAVVMDLLLDHKKMMAIKAYKDLVCVGLKEAKDLVDGAPKVVKEGVKKEEADTMKKTLEEAGAQVTLK